jgi:hypothetical protein
MIPGLRAAVQRRTLRITLDLLLQTIDDNNRFAAWEARRQTPSTVVRSRARVRGIGGW